METLETGALARGYRTDDVCAVYVEAALRELAAGNAISTLSVKWFGENVVRFEAQADALDSLGLIPHRELIVGVDPSAYPLSYAVGKSYSGFDVELAKMVCDLLGWSIRYQPIEPGDVYIELSSGNIDCAWGGLRLDPEATKFAVTKSYLDDDVVLVSRTNSKYRNIRSLRETKVISVDNTAFRAAAGEELTTLVITWIGGGSAKDLFRALDMGEASAIITTTSALTSFE